MLQLWTEGRADFVWQLVTNQGNIVQPPSFNWTQSCSDCLQPGVFSRTSGCYMLKPGKVASLHNTCTMWASDQGFKPKHDVPSRSEGLKCTIGPDLSAQLRLHLLYLIRIISTTLNHKLFVLLGSPRWVRCQSFHIPAGRDPTGSYKQPQASFLLLDKHGEFCDHLSIKVRYKIIQPVRFHCLHLLVSVTDHWQIDSLFVVLLSECQCSCPPPTTTPDVSQQPFNCCEG